MSQQLELTKSELPIKRKGVFIGAYVPEDLKTQLQNHAKTGFRTLSQEVTRILTEFVAAKNLDQKKQISQSFLQK